MLLLQWIGMRRTKQRTALSQCLDETQEKRSVSLARNAPFIGNDLFRLEAALCLEAWLYER